MIAKKREQFRDYKVKRRSQFFGWRIFQSDPWPHILVFLTALLLVCPLGALRQPLDLQLLGSLEEGGQLLLGHVHLSSIHELEDGSEVRKGDILEYDDRVLGGVLLQQVLEVGRAGAQDHLVSFRVLTLGSDGHITEALLVPEVLEGGDHVGLEVIPPKTELLIVSHGVLITMTLDTTLLRSVIKLES